MRFNRHVKIDHAQKNLPRAAKSGQTRAKFIVSAPAHDIKKGHARRPTITSPNLHSTAFHHRSAALPLHRLHDDMPPRRNSSGYRDLCVRLAGNFYAEIRAAGYCLTLGMFVTAHETTHAYDSGCGGSAIRVVTSTSTTSTPSPKRRWWRLYLAL
jgi:hypothetical protein